MAGPHRPDLSVVIATRDRAHRLESCLARLGPTLSQDDEIVVVDSASSAQETREVATAFGATYIRVDAPGASRARNAGWRRARHEFVAFIDDDVHVDPTWVDAMAGAIAEADTHFVTGWIGIPPGSEDVVDPQPHMADPEPRTLDARSRGTFGASANLAARRDALERVSGFDERLGPATWFAAAEDADLFDRWVLAGLTGRYRPDVRVAHDPWRSKRDRLRQHWNYGKGTGARLRRRLPTNRRRALREAREFLWQRGLVQAAGRVRLRWWGGALSSLLRVLGALVGFVVALGRLREPWPTDQPAGRSGTSRA